MLKTYPEELAENTANALIADIIKLKRFVPEVLEELPDWAIALFGVGYVDSQLSIAPEMKNFIFEHVEGFSSQVRKKVLEITGG